MWQINKLLKIINKLLKITCTITSWHQIRPDFRQFLVGIIKTRLTTQWYWFYLWHIQEVTIYVTWKSKLSTQEVRDFGLNLLQDSRLLQLGLVTMWTFPVFIVSGLQLWMITTLDSWNTKISRWIIQLFRTLTAFGHWPDDSQATRFGWLALHSYGYSRPTNWWLTPGATQKYYLNMAFDV